MEHVGHQQIGQPERRLILPAYHVADAARYAGVSTGTVRNWQRAQKEFVPALAVREIGFSLSFLQLVELRFVAAMREANIQLRKIERHASISQGISDRISVCERSAEERRTRHSR